MKTLSLFAAILCSIFTINTATAQTINKETIKVWGNCGMCKTTIEKAAKKAGAKTANWNEDSKELKVSYAVNKTSSAKIQEAVAKSGYDTQDFTADNKAYDNLPGCCQYDRKGAPVAAAYSCPMHPDVTSDVPGKCSKCGMDLTKSAKEPMKMYSCPMHAGEKSDMPGKCSKCGMDMKEKMNQAVVYSCPMKCEGDKTYDKPGKCPVCGMNLTKSAKEPMQMQSMKMYSCPMHPEVTSDKPGKCSKCGMDLTKSTKEPMKMYSCPMHPEEKSNKPGKCSKCGMSLKEKQ